MLVELLPGGQPVVLPPSVALQLLTLSRVATPSPRPVARSFDGHAWEGAPPEPLQLEHCSGGSPCTVMLPRSDAGYRLEWRNATSISPEQMASRFLLQSTFGPTRATVDGLTAATTTATMASIRADTYNVLVPHSECRGTDLHDEYRRVRTTLALERSQLLNISVPKGSQPCDVFGIHPKLPILKSLYDEGTAAFVANIGALVEPLTVEEYKKKTRARPQSLFAHNTQQTCAQNLHADSLTAKGILGRIAHALTTQDDRYRTGVYSIDGNRKILEGDGVTANIIGQKGGVDRFLYYANKGHPFGETIGETIENMTATVSESALGETYLSRLHSAFATSESLGVTLEAASVSEEYTAAVEGRDNDKLGRQLLQVAAIIDARSALESERDLFFVSIGGFDTHSNLLTTHDEKFDLINANLHDFVTELKAKGVFDSVTLVTASDFGRTLTSNGRGTDHAWAPTRVPPRLPPEVAARLRAWKTSAASSATTDS